MGSNLPQKKSSMLIMTIMIQQNSWFSITFNYEDRPDHFSNYRSGFEMRTRYRCTQIEVMTHANEDRLIRRYHFDYFDQLAENDDQLPLNGVTLLSQVPCYWL